MTDEREKWEIVWLKLEHEQEALEQQIQALQTKLEIVNALRANVYDLRATLDKAPDEILPLLEPEANEELLDAVRRRLEKEEGTHYEKIEKFFDDRGNLPATIAEIETATGIARSSLTAVLYRTHSEKFRNVESSSSRAKLWQLAIPVPETTFDNPPDLEPPEPRGEEEIPF